MNRQDAEGRNIFQGGFLGLDNIGVSDRNAALPTCGHLEQSDGTSWMAMYCLDMLATTLELSDGKRGVVDENGIGVVCGRRHWRMAASGDDSEPAFRTESSTLTLSGPHRSIPSFQEAGKGSQ